MKKILLIEDDQGIRETTKEILELADYEVYTAGNGKKGVELARVCKADLIICDIMMPELDGYGVLYMLAKNPKTSSIPFIFLTAKAEKSDYRKGMNLGADDYLTKPFEEMELLEAVDIRLTKSEQFQKNFEGDISGVDHFIQEAKGLEEMNKLSYDRRNRHYKKKEALFYEGEFPNFLYFINKGKIKTYKMNEDGKELITGLYKEGDFVGYIALLENMEYPESAVVLEESEVYLIPRKDFLQVHQDNKEPGYFISGGYFKLPMDISKAITKENILSEVCFEKAWLKERGLIGSFKNNKLTRRSAKAKFLNKITTTNSTWNGHNSSGWKQDILKVNGFDERMQYGGQDRELGERLMNLGIKGKQFRYSAICLHLDHKRGYKNEESISKNLAIRADVKKNKITYTPFGILKN